MKPPVQPLEDHPIAAVFPLLSSDELSALGDDIKVNGLRHKIILHEGKILDGRNRYRAARTAEIEPVFEPYTGNDPVGFVVSLNIHRRNLDPSQRAMIAADLANMKIGAPTGNNHAAKGEAENKSANLHSSFSLADGASKLGVSRRSVADAVTVKKSGTPELQEAVRTGNASVSAAAVVAKLPAAEQKKAVEGGRAAVASAAKSGAAPATGARAVLLAKLGKVVSADTITAIEQGTIRMTDAELYGLAEKDGNVIQKAINLMHSNGWPLRRALRSIEQPIDQESKVDDLIHLCIGAGGKWSGLFVLDAFCITVEHLKPPVGKP